MSHITGAHAFKTGLTMMEGRRQTIAEVNEDVSYSFRNGLPTSLTEWAPYSGTNLHDKHAHTSILDTARDDMRPWWQTGAAPSPTLPVQAPTTHHTIGGFAVARIILTVPCDSAGDGSADVITAEGHPVPYGQVLAVSTYGIADKYDTDTHDTATMVPRAGVRDSGTARVVVAGGPPKGGLPVLVLTAD